MQFMVDNVDVAVRDAFKYSVNYMFKNYSLDVLGDVRKEIDMNKPIIGKNLTEMEKIKAP